jgi:plastocyanin
MRRTATLFLFLLSFATIGFSKDVFLSIGGSVGNFRTDLRLFNPSSTKDIQVQAYLLAVGGVDNSAVQPKTITVPKRQMMVFDDVLTSLFQASGLAGIRLSSSDDFLATQRIYAATPAGTLGQFLTGIDTASAVKNGVLIQIKSSTAFRTNLGVLNPNAATASTTWRLYDKNNAVIGSPKTLSLPPYAVISPQEIKGFFGGAAATADLSDAWVSYTSDQPLVAYASVVDNGSTDPTYIQAAPDPGAPTDPTTTPPSTNKTLNVVARNGRIDITGSVTTLKVGDRVAVHTQILEGPHGFALLDPDGMDVFPAHPGASPGATFDDTFTVTKTGTYSYFCTNSGCGAHTGMFGTFDVGEPTGGGNPGY